MESEDALLIPAIYPPQHNARAKKKSLSHERNLFQSKHLNIKK